MVKQGLTIKKSVKRREGELWQIFKQLRKNRLALIGFSILALFIALAIFAPLITPYSPIKTEFANSLAPPSKEHWMGTDELGRDMFARIIYGTRISLSIGLIAVGIGATTGVPLGALSAYYGGKFDLLLQRIVDTMLAFPGILLVILLVTVLGTGLGNVMIAVGINSIPGYIRLVRGSVLSVKQNEYIAAARALGLGDMRIIVRHILPNCLGPVIVQSTFQVAIAILLAAGLGFLGLGAQPPDPEWGAMLSRGRIYMRTDPMLTFFPGLAIFFVVLALNLVGDGLRDALDPKSRRI
jgi:peptide/nickel transport system permease protein